MRRVSPKAARRNREAKPVRDALIEEVGRCEVCGHDPRRVRSGCVSWVLCVHEIARGPHRMDAMDKRCAVLVLCYYCHMERVHGNEAWPITRQLAVLKRRRPQDHDLTAFNRLRGREDNAITEEEVDQWLER